MRTIEELRKPPGNWPEDEKAFWRDLRDAFYSNDHRKSKDLILDSIRRRLPRYEAVSIIVPVWSGLSEKSEGLLGEIEHSLLLGPSPGLLQVYVETWPDKIDWKVLSESNIRDFLNYDGAKKAGLLHSLLPSSLRPQYLNAVKNLFLKDQLGYQDVVVEYLMDQQALTGDEALTALSKQGMNWPTQHLYVRLVRTSSLGRDALRNLTEGVLRRELTTITEPLLRDLEYEEEAISQIVRDSFILHTSFFDLEEVFSIAQLRCSPADMEKVVNSENYGTLMQKLAEAAVRSAAAPSGVRDRAEVRRAEQEPPRTAAEVQAISSGDSSDEHVHFTVYHPQSVGGKSKSRLLAYAHIAEATSRIQAHAGALLKNLSEAFEKRGGIATLDIQRGASITVAPYLPGCRFEPRILTFGWLEDWHCASFVVGMESTVSPGNVSGSVDFYVGPLLVASVPITVYCGSPPSASSAVSVPVTTTPYESIFVSYSHRDAKVVNGLQQAYKVLGIKYLRDIDQLRSGEEWSEALIGFIEKAAIFQLCWSRSAMGSAYVEREWRYAWSLSRRFFIRPVYWERPMPSPPAELSNLHFAYLSLQNDAPWWKRFRRSL